MDIQSYSDQTPTLRIEEYFNGQTRATGLFQDRFGKVRKRFDVDIAGSWNPATSTLQLIEDFVYDDGMTERRIWLIVKNPDGTYTGSAKNVIGVASGQAAGNAFRFQYKFNLAVGDKIWPVSFDDWMFLQPDGKTLFNKATIRRWGFRLGDVYITFDKN